MQKRILLLIPLSICCSTLLYAYSPANKASISWKEGKVVSIAYYCARYDEQGLPVDFASFPRTQSSAKIAAYESSRDASIEQMAYALRDIRIDASSTLGSLLDAEPFTQQGFYYLLRERTRMRNMPHDTFTSVSEGTFMLRDLIRCLPFEFPNKEIPRAVTYPLATEYTGIIIDARGLGIRPMLLPSLYDENGTELFGRSYAEITHATPSGLVLWCTNEREAKSNALVGQQPYFAQSLRVQNGSPVISNRDKNRIMGHKKTVEKLKSCHVIYIIDPVKDVK